MNDSNEINLWTGGWLLGAPIWLILNGIELLDGYVVQLSFMRVR